MPRIVNQRDAKNKSSVRMVLLTCMDNVHGTHSASSIVEHPFLLQIEILPLKFLIQLPHDIVHHGARVVAMRGNGPPRQVMQVLRVEDVEPVEVLVQVVENRGKEAQHDRKDGQAGVAARMLGRLFGDGHCCLFFFFPRRGERGEGEEGIHTTDNFTGEGVKDNGMR